MWRRGVKCPGAAHARVGLTVHGIAQPPHWIAARPDGVRRQHRGGIYGARTDDVWTDGVRGCGRGARRTLNYVLAWRMRIRGIKNRSVSKGSGEVLQGDDCLIDGNFASTVPIVVGLGILAAAFPFLEVVVGESVVFSRPRHRKGREIGATTSFQCQRCLQLLERVPMGCGSTIQLGIHYVFSLHCVGCRWNLRHQGLNCALLCPFDQRRSSRSRRPLVGLQTQPVRRSLNYSKACDKLLFNYGGVMAWRPCYMTRMGLRSEAMVYSRFRAFSISAERSKYSVASP